ncbi:hypothetical protein [Halovivax gelatinilyticus]|uniref:hypothetical protein n=1 Tax=Halovivax gelatinilyticus TaxID=2961597 RepID=UPI0020CA5A5D|nr:hypothetical protein [Halovivax gelatinilyticus]
MSEPVAWRIDPATDRTVRCLHLSQVGLVDGWALVGTGLLCASAVGATSIGPIAGFVTVAILLARVLAWIDSDREWLTGLDGEVAAAASTLGRTSGESDHPELVALGGTLIAGAVLYLGGYALLGESIVLLALGAGLVGAVSFSLLEGASTGGEIDPVDDRLRYGSRTRRLSSVAGCQRLTVGSLVLVRLQGRAGLDEPRWLVVSRSDAAPVTSALTRKERGSVTDSVVADEPSPVTHWRRLRAPPVAVAVLSAVVVPVAGLSARHLEGLTAAAAVALAAIALGTLLAVIHVSVRPSRVRIE